MQGEELSSTSTSVSSKYLAHLIFLSYRFSQGGIGTQNRILLHLEENYFPELMRGDSAVRELTHRSVAKYFLDQRLHPATAIPWEEESWENFVKTEQLVTNELTGLFERFRYRDSLRSFSSDLVGIAKSVVLMDADYLRRSAGRASGSIDLKTTVGLYRRDPYSSFFVSHSLLDLRTGSTEYDHIFNSLSSKTIIEQFDCVDLRHLKFVLNVYANHHPEVGQNERFCSINELSAELLNAW